MSTIITRKDEIRLVTCDPKEMLGKYLVKRLLRSWKEDFIDEDSQEVISVERNEIIAEAGSLIDNDLVTEIQFFLQSGDITEIEVSNQCRQAIFEDYSNMVPWSINAIISRKKHRFLLYADSVTMAFEVVKDYIELNHTGSFSVTQIRALNDCILIDNEFLKKYEGNEEGKKFYKIEVKITYDEMENRETFIVFSSDVDTAMEIIKDWVYKKIKESNKNNDKIIDIDTAIEKVITIPCDTIIDRDFSLAYTENL